MELPKAFTDRMREDLGDEADSFLGSYLCAPKKALRINTLKIGQDEEDRLTSGMERVPWEAHGYYYADTDEPGKSPLHSAGAYYIQEPSAMAPVNLLDVRPGMCVLDLCAAPGGKSTQIAARLMGQGVLIANEIVPERAKILSQNIERMGIANAVVTNHDPADLKAVFPASFDRILVDAPCSGEGMFRKDDTAIAEWSEDNVRLCAARQADILDAAAVMLKPGGRLVYSTCTFSKEEDEIQAARFLANNTGLHSTVMGRFAGMRTCDMKNAYKIWPQDGYGEGHFMAVFERDGRAGEGEVDMACGYAGRLEKGLGNKEKQSISSYVDFLKESFIDGDLRQKLLDTKRLFYFKDRLCLMPECGLPSLAGLRVIRAGLELGEIRKGRFIPAHALALHVDTSDARSCIDLSGDDARLRDYLNGQTLRCGEYENLCYEMKDPASENNGWCLMAVSGVSLGWVKRSNGMFKNHYPKGLRINY